MGGWKGNAPSSSGPQPDVLLLNYQPHMAPRIGLEPTTLRLEGGCSIPTELAGHMVEPGGIEPPTQGFSVLGSTY